MKKKKNNTLLIVAVAILALGGASAATGYLLKQDEDLPSSQVSQSEDLSEEPSEELVLAERLELIFDLSSTDPNMLFPLFLFNSFEFSDGEIFKVADDSNILTAYSLLAINFPSRETTLSIDSNIATLSFIYYPEDTLKITMYEGPLDASGPTQTLEIIDAGRYDFSSIEILEGQVLIPVYTPIYV